MYKIKGTSKNCTLITDSSHEFDFEPKYRNEYSNNQTEITPFLI